MTTARVCTLHLTPSGRFPVALVVTINAEADRPDLVSDACDGPSIYVGKKTIWINQMGGWAIWAPEQPMDVDVFGETLYVAPCTTKGIQLVATLQEHAESVGATRMALGVGMSDGMLDVLYDKLKGAVEPDTATEPVSNTMDSSCAS